VLVGYFLVLFEANVVLLLAGLCMDAGVLVAALTGFRLIFLA